MGYSVSKLIEDIDMGEIGLPDIRRSFVWTAAKVQSLDGLEEAVDQLRRDHRAGVCDGDDGLVALDRVEISTPPGTW